MSAQLWLLVVTADNAPPSDAVFHEGVEGWTISQSSDDLGLLDSATALLAQELPDARFESNAYLTWAYRENPLGRAVERYQQVEGAGGVRLVAHYANMPRRFRGPDGARCEGMWSLNAVVRSGHQRARHFSRLGLEIYDEASSARCFVVGVTNAKSTGAVVKYMGWRLVGPLPVKVLPSLGRSDSSIEHIEATDEWLASTDFDAFAAKVDRHPVCGWATDYEPQVLRWRLACPSTRYSVHITNDLALVTVRARYGPLPACVVVKAFPLTDTKVNANRAIQSAARHHRAAFAVYAGFNRSVVVRGIRSPRRLQPSPLNLIVRHLDPSVDQDALVLDTFEFLDMDAF